MNKARLLILLSLLSWKSRGQAVPGKGDDLNATSDVKSISAQATKGFFNTDLFSGTATVSVPIYNYSVAGLDLGVSLSYKATGVKVDDIASRAGIGWDLVAAPSIQQIPNGLEDQVWLAQGSSNQLRGSWMTSSANKELNYDVFVADLGGRQIKFSIEFMSDVIQCEPFGYPSDCLLPDRTITSVRVATYPRSEVKVELLYGGARVYNKITWAGPNNPQYNPALFTFRVTDERLNVFYFDVVETLNKDFEWKDKTVTSYFTSHKWYVSKIKTHTGAEIKYWYDQRGIEYPQYHDERTVEQIPYEVHADNGTVTYFGGMADFVKNQDVPFDCVSQQLSKIRYPNGVEIDFINHSTLYRRDVLNLPILEKVRVSSKYDNNVHNYIDFKFNQDYFYAQGATPTRALNATYDGTIVDYRLRLNSIDRSVDGGAIEKYYSFTYDDTRLPARLSPSQDYYGYFNNKTPLTIPSGFYTNTTGHNPTYSMPLHAFSYSSNYASSTAPSSYSVTYGTDKTPDINYVKAGVLKKVKNSFGGESEFFYEAHNNLSTPPNSNSYCATIETGTNSFDGLRIQRVEYRDGFTSDNNFTKRYEYEDGYRFYPKFYYWYPTVYPNSNTPAQPFLVEQVIVQKRWYSQQVNSMELFNGFNHGYSVVTEVEEGYNGSVIGKSKYYFSNIINTETTTGKPLGSSRVKETKRFSSELTSPSYMDQFEMGLLLKKEDYISNGTTDILVSKVENEYETSTVDMNSTIKNYPKYVQSKRAQFSASTMLGWDSDVLSNSESLFSLSKRRLKKSTTTKFSGATQLQQLLEYEYDGYDNVTKVKWKDSKGEDYYKQYSYRYTGYSQNIYNTAIYKDLATDIPLQQKYTSYMSTQLDNYNEELAYDVIGESNTSYASTGFFVDKKDYIAFDSKRNVTEIKHRDGVRYTAQLWDTLLCNKLAEVTNARLADIAYTSFEGLNNPSRTYDSYDMGYWQFNRSQVYLGSSLPGTPNPGKAMTGKYCYELTNSSSTDISRVINGDMNFKLSLWANKAPVVKVDGATIVGKVAYQTNNYSLYVYKIGVTINPPPTRLLTITNTSAFPTYIDELRLCPQEAEITTYTYEPMLGVSSVCDEEGDIIYSEYDTQGRLWQTKDARGNILNQIDRVMQGSKW